jgi:hypothetical protein
MIWIAIMAMMTRAMIFDIATSAFGSVRNRR